MSRKSDTSTLHALVFHRGVLFFHISLSQEDFLNGVEGFYLQPPLILLLYGMYFILCTVNTFIRLIIALKLRRDQELVCRSTLYRNNHMDLFFRRSLEEELDRRSRIVFDFVFFTQKLVDALAMSVSLQLPIIILYLYSLNVQFRNSQDTAFVFLVLIKILELLKKNGKEEKYSLTQNFFEIQEKRHAFFHLFLVFYKLAINHFSLEQKYDGGLVDTFKFFKCKNIIKILKKIMIDSALGFTSPQRRNAYYFQFYANTIKLKRGQSLPEQAFSIKFAVTKDNQILSKSRVPIQIKFCKVSEVLSLKKCHLNFYVGDINIASKSSYEIKVFVMNGREQIDSEGTQINVCEYVSQFNREKKFNFSFKKDIGNFFVDFDIFTEKSRASLDRVVREVKQELYKNENQSQPTEISYPASRRKCNSQTPSETSDLSKPKKIQRVKNESSCSNRFKKVRENVIVKEEPPKRIRKISIEEKVEQVEIAKLKHPKPLKIDPTIKREKINEPNTQKSEEISSPKPAISGLQSITYKKERRSIDISQSMNKSFKHQKLVNKKDEKPSSQQESLYKVKMVLFLIFSLFLIYQAMIPTRRAPHKK